MGGNGVPIARLFGIEIRVSFTWAILVAIVTLLGAQQAALTAPGLAAPVQWLIGVAIAIGFLVSVVVHELAMRSSGGGTASSRRRSSSASSADSRRSASRRPRPRDELAIALSGPLLSLALGGLCSALGVLDAVVAPGPRCARGQPRRARRAQRHPRRASACCPACRSTAAGSSGRSPGRARRTVTVPGRYRAGRPAARVHGHRRRDRDGARRPRHRGPARHRARLAAHDRRPDARPAARARAAAARRHGSRGDGGRSAVGRAQPHVDTFADRYEGPDAVPAIPVVDEDHVLGSSAGGGSSGWADAGSGPPARPTSWPSRRRRRSSRPTTRCGTRWTR